MPEILQHALNMPTAVFTVLLGLAAVYWVAALAGFFSFEMFHGLEHLFGIGDATHGIGHAVDSLDAVADGGGHGGFFHMVGLHDVPRSVSWSLTTLFSWAISLATSVYVPGYDALVTRGLFVVVGIGVGCLVVAVGVTAIAIQPLRRILAVESDQTRSDLVGQTCVVRTGRVDESFGQAELVDGSAVLQVRARPGEPAEFKRGTRARVVEYDPENETFYVTLDNVTPDDEPAGTGPENET
jgi:hypothetical protein